MEKVKNRHEILVKALKSLKQSLELIKLPEYQKVRESMRDSVVQRFEFTIDTFWKFIKLYLQEKTSVDVTAANPRGILRTAVNAKLISSEEYEVLLKGLRHRNLTSHIYDEERAEKIFAHIPEYYKAMNNISEKLKVNS